MPEHTIAENLTRLQAATAAIGAAITQKGGTVNALDNVVMFVNTLFELLYPITHQAHTTEAPRRRPQ